MTRRVTNRLAILWTCCVLSVLCSAPLQWESRASADVPSTEPPASSGASRAAASEQAVERRAPEKAYALLEALRQRDGEPLPGYVGGKLFQNRERRLPSGR